MNSGIYCIENKINGKKYIGQSADLGIRERWHFRILKNGNHVNLHLQRAYNKYGKDAFEFKIILYAEPDELTRYEQKLVDKYKPEELYNICLECVKSTLGIKLSKETRERISLAKTGISSGMKGKRHSAETRRKISLAQFGKKHHSEEGKRKQSLVMKKYWASPRGEERKRKMSVVRTGRHPSEETKRKMSIAQKNSWAERKRAFVSMVK